MTSLAWSACVVAASLVILAGIRSRRDLARWLGGDPLPRLRVARSALLVVGLVATTLALERSSGDPPQLEGASSDVVIVVDVSRSMDTRDTAPSRLRRGLRLTERFVEAAGGTRLGLVVFAGAAFPVLPLTQDRDAVLTYLRGLDTWIISRPGTDLPEALRVASRVFDPRSSRPRSILLLSDGENGGSGLSGALQELRAHGIRVVAVGLGTPRGGIVPVAGGEGLRDPGGDLVRSRRVDATLEQIAAATGGVLVREPEQHPDPRRLIPPPAPGSRAREVPIAPVGLEMVIAVLALAGEMGLGSPFVRSRRRRRARLAGGTLVAGIALALVAAGPRSWTERGDALLERGQAREALSLYRRVERTRGWSAPTQIRVGNALYRMGQAGLAAGAYVEALRRLETEERDARFVAAFNLGTALLVQERYDEAREAFWTALVARPESLEAKFNYEWALDRIPPEEDAEASAPSRPTDPAEQAADLEGAEAHARSHGGDAPDDRIAVTEEEARDWLRSLEEDPTEPLREQLSSMPGDRGGRQTW